MKMFRQLTSFVSVSLLCLITTVNSAQAANRDEVIFFFNDHLGSAVAAVNESGELCWSEEYTAYGDKGINDDVVNEIGCGIVGEERGFTGHTEDMNSDLVYMQQRYYDPSIGRFLSIDPREANPNEPMTFNRYAYANNNPYKYTDPNGEIPVLIWGLYVGATAALTAYDSYQAYQEGGAPALAKQAAVDIALSAVGAKVASKVAGSAIDGVETIADVARGSGKGVTNPSVSKLARPSRPAGITQSQFGKDVIGWGSGPQGALDRLGGIDANAVAKMQEQGLTKKMATEWRDFYSNEFSRNANNTAAANRVELMNKILDNF